MRVAAALLILWVSPVLAAPPVAPGEGKPAAHRPAPSPAVKPAAHRPGAGPGHKPAKPAAAKPPAAPTPTPAPASPAAPEAQAPPRRVGSGLPIPRFASLKTDDVNFRRGPGSQYPVDWVYKRRDLPVEIEREFDNYRLVRDPDGTRGWVHQATLTGRRTAVVEGEERVLRDGAADTGAAIAKLKPRVIVRLRRCEQGSDWCQVTVGDYGGYLKRSELWGLLPGEVIP